MIVALICFYGIGLILGIKYPSYFILYYILASTKFLGFIDPSSFIVSGIEIGYFGLNLTAIVSLFFKRRWYVIPQETQWFIYFVVAMLLYGIIKPFLDNNSSLYLALMASKETWFYFLFLYMVVYRDKINNPQLLKLMRFLGLYLSSIYIIGIIIPQFAPPLYYNGIFIRTFFPTYISLALFLYAIKIKFSDIRNLKDRLIIIYLFLGLFLAAHLSITAMTIVGFILYKYIYDKKLTLNKNVIIRFSLIAFLGISLALLFIKGLYDTIAINVDGIITGENNSLSSRDIYNGFRWEAINKKKELGYGFIHQSSDFMKGVKTHGSNRFMERFTVIDSGYVDMLIKFGYIGTIIILIILARYYAMGFFKAHKNPLSLAMSIYLMQYLFVNYTWSVFTFAHGIIPGVIAFHLILSSKSPYAQNNTNSNL